MGQYFTYGLEIQSDLSLPELNRCDRECQLIIRLANDLVPKPDLPDRSGWRKLGRDEALLYLNRIGLFQLRAGEEVIVWPDPETRDSLLRLAVYGPVLAGLLFQRGLLVLHASSLIIEGSTVAFLGESGYGKSSAAATLALRGHAIATDDVTPVELHGELAFTYPGFPRLKLHREVTEALGLNINSLAVLDPELPDLGWMGPLPSSTGPFPLQRVYILGQGKQVELQQLSARESLIELLRHTYPTCIGLPGDAMHFEKCSLLASTATFRRLIRTRDLSTLTQLANLVQADLDEELRSD